MRVLLLALLLVSFDPTPGVAGPPSASTSEVPPGVPLVGHAGAPDPAGTVTYVIRHASGTLRPGTLVVLSLAGCSDVRLAGDVVAPGTTVDCANRLVQGVTNSAGEVSFTIVGAGIAGAAGNGLPCLQAFADGIPLPPLIVSVYDLDGVNGVTAQDLSIFAGDLLSGQYRTRSDHDYDGRLTAMDLGLWARVFLGGASPSSGAACGP